MITIEVEGVRYTHFKEISISSFLDSFADEFNITATADELTNFPIKQRAKCRALINDIPIVTGFIETIEISYDAGSHDIRITGSDKTVDVTDGTCGDGIVFEGEITFKSFIELVLKKSDITGIKVINEVADIKTLKEGEAQAGEVGETIFAFIERIARKLQVILTSDGNGDIVITRSSTQSVSGFQLINRLDNPTNTILSASRTLNDKGRFNRYIAKSQTSSTNLFSDPQPSSQTVNKEGGATDSEIRPTRILRFEAESATETEGVSDRATWEANIRRIRSESYEVVVAGHTIPGTDTPIPVNRLIKVDDIFADISAVMLINRVTYNLSEGASNTTIGLVTKDAYTVQAQEPIKDKRSNKQSINFKKVS